MDDDLLCVEQSKKTALAKPCNANKNAQKWVFTEEGLIQTLGVRG